MVERSIFFKIQDSFCVDSIKDFWNEKRTKVITQFQPKGPVVILGDARMDSPGFCAQYCTYSAMDNAYKQIISIVSLDKRETQRNSVIMEKEGFSTSYLWLHIVLLITFLYPWAKGLLKDSGIHHSWVWHGSKNLNKKLVAVSLSLLQLHALGHQHSGIVTYLFSDIMFHSGQSPGRAAKGMLWPSHICNHIWYCCKVADSYEQFMVSSLWRNSVFCNGWLHCMKSEVFIVFIFSQFISGWCNFTVCTTCVAVYPYISLLYTTLHLAVPKYITWKACVCLCCLLPCVLHVCLQYIVITGYYLT